MGFGSSGTSLAASINMFHEGQCETVEMITNIEILIENPSVSKLLTQVNVEGFIPNPCFAHSDEASKRRENFLHNH